MSYSGVIFDLDGTLLNTLDDMADSVNSILEKHGFPIHDVEKYKYFIGNGMEKLIRRAVPESILQDEEMVKTCLDEFMREYDRRWDKLTRPYNEINDLMEALDNNGIEMSVLSNKPNNFTRVLIDKFFGLKRFKIVFGARENVPKKPDPTAALEISKLSKIPVEEYLYLGDTGVDMKTANAAGMYAVGVTWGFRKADELLENGAKKIIDNPMELIELIK